MRLDEIPYLDPDAETTETHNRLPHRQQTEGTYFVTFRLKDALPRSLLGSWEEEREAWLKHHPMPWRPDVDHEYHRLSQAELSNGSIRAMGVACYALEKLQNWLASTQSFRRLQNHAIGLGGDAKPCPFLVRPSFFLAVGAVARLVETIYHWQDKSSGGSHRAALATRLFRSRDSR
jgi:hypothetical protein